MIADPPGIRGGLTNESRSKAWVRRERKDEQLAAAQVRELEASAGRYEVGGRR
jgi:hypothetical protein